MTQAPDIETSLPEDPELRSAMLKRVTDELWRRGNLRYKLDETQVRIKEFIDARRHERKLMLFCSRRLGKSFTLTLLAFETALKKPGARILYLAPTAKDAALIVTDLASVLMADCPEYLKPEYRAQDKEFVFKNGSRIRFRGVNSERADDLRGGAADLVICDESGSWDELNYVLSSVVMPLLLTTGGQVILATTPARTPGHDSSAIYEELMGKDAAIRFTLNDNPRISRETKAEFLKEAGERDEDIPKILNGEMLPRGTTALREYWCIQVTDADSAVLPEWTEEVTKECVRETERPAFFDCYVALDPGMVDRTGILFAYWDFIRAKLVIEDEALLHKASTLTIADEIKRKEQDLWRGKEPYTRVSDVDLRLIADLWERHRIQFTTAAKQDSLGAINLVRNMIQMREIEINPRCVHLIRQMHNAVWNRKATDFARAGEKSMDGHFDLVAALKYLCRSINRHRNPYPNGYFVNRGPDNFRSPRTGQRSGTSRGLLPNTPFANRLVKKKGKTR